MSSAHVIDALFVRTVDMVQSLPKTGPIQTSYEEKLALYSLYKQATEADVQSKRPGMLDMLGRAKWDAWAKVRGLPSRDAKQMYVESMLRILRRFGDRPQAIALIEGLENFSGQVAQRVMDGSLAEVDSEGSTVSSAASSPRARHMELQGNPSRAPEYAQNQSRPPPAGLASRNPHLLADSRVSSTSNMRAGYAQRPSSTAGTSTAATRGGEQAGISPGRTPLGSESGDESTDDDQFDPRMDRLPIPGPSVDSERRFSSAPSHLQKQQYYQHGQPSQMRNNSVGGGPARSQVSSPPPSALGLRTNRPASNSGAPSRYHSVGQPSAPPSQGPPFQQQSYQRSAYAPSSVDGRSIRTGQATGSFQPPPPRPASAAQNRSEIDLALQSIQASLAALHERLNRVESTDPTSDDGRRRRDPSSLSATRRLYDAMANIVHDVRQLLGLESTSQRSARSEALAPSFLASGNGRGKGATVASLLSAPIRIFVALVNLAARLALDVISLALVSSIVLYLFRQLTGRGDPLLALRILRRLRQALLRRAPGAARIAEAVKVAA